MAGAKDTPMNPRSSTLSRSRSAAPGTAGISRRFRAPAGRGGGRSEAEAVDKTMNEIRKLLPRVASYVWETDFFQPDWQEAFWGENHGRRR